MNDALKLQKIEFTEQENRKMQERSDKLVIENQMLMEKIKVYNDHQKNND